MAKPLTLADLGKRYAVPPPVEPEDGPYYEAIGRFIVAYAQAEGSIHALARKLSGLKEEKARVFFAGMRLGDIKNRILAIARLSNRTKSVKDDIEACLQQFDVIGTERDKMVHRFVHYESGSIKITNEMTSKSMLSYEQDMFAMDALLRLQLDCLTINLRIAHVTNPFLKKTAPKPLLKQLHGPWSYKPVPPKIRKKPSQAEQAIADILIQQRASQT